MGRRGPPPMPEAQRKMRGRRHRKKEKGTVPPSPPLGTPEMPAIVREHKLARATWKQLCADLTEMRVLSPQHGMMLGALCVSFAYMCEAHERTMRDGLLLTTKRGKLYAHPAYRVEMQMAQQVLTLAREFGLTPSAAMRVRVNASTPDAARQQEAQQSAESFLFGSPGKVIGSIGKKRDK